jgi:hypothetical protein
MTDGTRAMAEAIARESVTSAIREELLRSNDVRRRAQDGFFVDSLSEVQRLRSVVTAQTQQIAELQTQVAFLKKQNNELRLRDLVESVSASVFSAGSTFDGYAIKDAKVQIRAAFTIDGGDLAITADPGGLMNPTAMSTVEFSLAALPPRAGEPSRDEAIDLVRLRAQEVQAVIVDSTVDPAARASLLAAVTNVSQSPHDPEVIAGLAAPFDLLAATAPDLRESAQGAAEAARGVVADPSAQTIVTLANSLMLVAQQVKERRA